ncbi:hypothetical protein GLOIN_2v1735866 [Rhizophagus irregularis DAOM 181602=DAOM 197198]|uniref:rRNA-processing protein FYV7 n=2 Tax=Rhizophagus irregularis TaxID=588596 RepID=A0A2N1MY93_9GLOM|nr:hypothetical protein GLOIN_2v1735866 [Rhizophagus irregularis DAOM 181602=DAOM 197198]PKK66607.1 hypothetical protein RhiirC2_24970 [Rhizophagus irregularis]POG57888.1 hypothetical protein GLOIN_2v1735866 [Rhizophagus irregularis DAOM 181602=DAOM 197198]|eukprot:XP_025164754.1 hypothetical protein GLOIN_2v1735866 [Rhizophagus irregularis DAOM 181602=DAOM 197198]
MGNLPKNRTRNSYHNKAKQIRKKLIRKAKIKKDFYKTLIFDFDTNIEKTFASSLRNESEVEKGRKDQKDNIEIKKSKSNRKSKPNPFYKVFQERERIHREKCAEKESIREERKLYKQKREAYNARRNKTKKKLMKCTYKGQPIMKSRIDHILSKI